MHRDRHTLSAAVFVALFDNQKVCMLRRKATGWMDGSFSLAAGSLEADEAIRSAARRETREELGVEINPEDLAYVHTMHCRTTTGDWVGHYFSTARWLGIPELREPHKHRDLGWWPLDALPAETIPYVRQALTCIRQRQPYSEFGWSAPSAF